MRRLDHGRRLVILDEIQKQPALLDAVELLGDRKAGHRFLLLGSSQVVLQKVRETLVGRATLLELWPFALVERTDEATVPASGLHLVWRDGEDALERLHQSPLPAEQIRRRRPLADNHRSWGGYPALAALPEPDRTVWLRDFRRTYLERDLADLGRVPDLDQFALAENLLAARTAQVLSYS